MAAEQQQRTEPDSVAKVLLLHLMPDKCYEHFFIHFDCFHVPCLRIVLSKTVGPWIILATVMAQIPQVMKMLRRRSSEGLSLIAVLLQLYSSSAPLVYCMRSHFPLSAWGERLLLSIQTAAVAFLTLHYRGNSLKGLFLLFCFAAIVLLLGNIGTASVISAMQSSSTSALIASKAVQASSNSSRGHTGALSRLSVFLVWAESWALIFVSLQETGASLSTLARLLSAALSCLLLLQVLSSERKAKHKRE